MSTADLYFIVWLLGIPFWIGVLKNFRSPALEIDTIDYVCCIVWPLTLALIVVVFGLFLVWRAVSWLPMKLGEAFGAVMARVLE